MEFRQRIVTACLWLAVAGVIATTVDVGIPTTAADAVRVLVVALAVFLAGVYAFDPKGIVSRKPF
ncbi:hypothetical protein ACFQGT_15540 [Natrialbaceae archaeon GCM10025810]|uniref:hypothetical protein n=1 Tax=Halovalidus salilacus TaxID=3075124 RepID=UPI0036211FD3